LGVRGGEVVAMEKRAITCYREVLILRCKAGGGLREEDRCGMGTWG